MDPHTYMCIFPQALLIERKVVDNLYGVISEASGPEVALGRNIEINDLISLELTEPYSNAWIFCL